MKASEITLEDSDTVEPDDGHDWEFVFGQPCPFCNQTGRVPCECGRGMVACHCCGGDGVAPFLLKYIPPPEEE